MSPEDAKQSKKSIGIYIAVVLMLLIFWGTFDQTINGLILSNNELGLNVLLSALCWWYVWKKLGKNQIIGVTIGATAYFIVYTAAILLSTK